MEYFSLLVGVSVYSKHNYLTPVLCRFAKAQLDLKKRYLFSPTVAYFLHLSHGLVHVGPASNSVYAQTPFFLCLLRQAKQSASIS